jgi:prepilin-type N-terminal cleavage/methylation domain-containing protein
MKKKSHCYQGFSLIEMITVITIIAILSGLLFPAIRGVRLAAKKTAARTTINSLGLALKAYFEEYGKWPTLKDDTTPKEPLNADQLVCLMLMLTGTDCYLDDPVDSIAPATKGNRKHIRFIDFKNDLKEVSTTLEGEFPTLYTVQPGSGKRAVVDPWNYTYNICFDHDGDGDTINVYAAPEGTSSLTTHHSFAIWSAGNDHKVDSATEKDMNNPTAEDNKDNITSWN